MINFCTYCDSRYAARLLCLHASLRAKGEPFRLHVLCFDDVMERIVRAAGHHDLVPLPLRELLAADPAFARVREDRSRVEFYFTATPVLVRHCFGLDAAVDHLVYLDSDLYFFGRPSAVLAEQGVASVGIVPHRFPPRLAALERHGRYNVGWVAFRRDGDGLAAVEWWRERCLEWCRDVVDQGRYADQGYLDEFPRRFRGVRALEHPGINAAPWNVDGAAVLRTPDGVTLQGVPLLFFHFQGVRELLPGWYDPGLLFYAARPGPGLREHVYRPYLQQLAATQAQLSADFGLVPQRGYHRMGEGGGWRARLRRWGMRRLLPRYRWLRGQLIYARGRNASALD